MSRVILQNDQYKKGKIKGISHVHNIFGLWNKFYDGII
jgi:hypothetical protein